MPPGSARFFAELIAAPRAQRRIYDAMNALFSMGGRLDPAESLAATYFAGTALVLLLTLVLKGPCGLRSLVDRIDRVLLIAAQVMIVALMLLLFVAIFGRATFKLFLELGLPGISIPDSSIISQIMMVAIVFFTVGNAQKIGAHIEVTAIANLLPSRVNLVLHLFALSVGIVIIGGAAWFSAVRAAEDYYNHAFIFSSVLYLVEWPGRSLVPLGLAWWALRMLLQLLIAAERYHVFDHVKDRLAKVG